MLNYNFYIFVGLQGWKLPDMMFATRRSLSEASTKIAKELENVYASISASVSDSVTSFLFQNLVYGLKSECIKCSICMFP